MSSSWKLAAAIPPMAIAGALFSVCWFLLADAFILMNREPDTANHVSFMWVMPTLATLLGFGIINLTSPEDVVSAGLQSSVARGGGVECSKPFAFLFIGWFMCFGSTILTLCSVGANFLGETTRTQAFPAFAVVFHSCLLPAVAALLWFSVDL